MDYAAHRLGERRARRPRTRAATRRSAADITDALDGPAAQTIVVRGGGRSARPGQAARQAGLAAGAALDLVPAHHRHLADRLAGARAPRPVSAGSAGRRNLERWEIGLEARVDGRRRATTCGSRQAHADGDRLLADDTLPRSIGGEVHRRIALSDPGIDDSRNELLWSPERPTLIDAELQLLRRGRRGASTRWSSYTALRSVGVQGDRFVLNGRPYPLRLVLDQGYWPESGLTRARRRRRSRRDVELAKAMGFNGVRKHQKIEDPRFLYWADRLGLLVWEEMPSAYRFTTAPHRAR